MTQVVAEPENVTFFVGTYMIYIRDYFHELTKFYNHEYNIYILQI